MCTATNCVTSAADRKTVRLLAELQYPADIGLDRQRGLLFVPLFWDSRVIVYQLPTVATRRDASVRP